MNRRKFLKNTAASALINTGAGALINTAAGAIFAPAIVRAASEPKFKTGPLTHGPNHHFFGYYGIFPWNKSQKDLVCLESGFQDHLPKPEEPGSIGLVDLKSGKFTKIEQTHAWNFQQGTMLHWNPLNAEDEILYNERQGDNIVSALLNVRTKKKRILPRAINGVSHNGRLAVCLTYGRMTRLRPVVGYVGAKDPNPEDPHPKNDGVFIMDLSTGEPKLVVSIDEVYRVLLKKYPQIEGRHMWFNHTVFNKDDTRFFFLARTWTPGPKPELDSAMFTAGIDGSGLREVVPFGKRVSHFEWRNDKQILATFRPDGDEVKHILFTDGKSDFQSIGEGFFKGDGHCSFAPDGEWIVTDRNVSETREKLLMIYNLSTKKGVMIGAFPVREYLSGDLRCDLHPRWSRDGRSICFDALETKNWTRQVHIAEMV